jgi:FtsP/CotA-like multicopper oxidase with cupredoxin domain
MNRREFLHVARLSALSSVEIDLVADDPGLTLYHCHMQLHQDFGFMGLMKYAEAETRSTETDPIHPHK